MATYSSILAWETPWTEELDKLQSTGSQRVRQYLATQEQQQIIYIHTYIRDSLVARTVKRLPAMSETRVQSPGQEDPLEKEMATHSSTLAWRIPWTEGPGRL